MHRHCRGRRASGHHHLRGPQVGQQGGWGAVGGGCCCCRPARLQGANACTWPPPQGAQKPPAREPPGSGAHGQGCVPTSHNMPALRQRPCHLLPCRAASTCYKPGRPGHARGPPGPPRCVHAYVCLCVCMCECVLWYLLGSAPCAATVSCKQQLVGRPGPQGAPSQPAVVPARKHTLRCTR